jgi:hypothetical protein
MADLNQAVMAFRDELNKIESEDVKVFVVKALELASSAFSEDESVITHVKKVYRIVDSLLDKEGTRGMLRDMMLGAVLLCDLTVNDAPEPLQYLHPVTVDHLLQDIKNDIHKGMYDGFLSMIEGHEGNDSPSAQLDPKAGTPQYVIALANKIARFDFVTIEI